MKVIVIEDEAPASRRLIKMIMEYDPEIQVLGTIESVKTGIEWFSQNTEPDLIFSDIQLSDDFCFTIFKQMNVSAPIIFTTAYDEYALNAFRFYSIDYLLKPIRQQELNRSIDKFKSIQKQKNSTDFEALLARFTDRDYKSRFLIYSNDCLIPVKTCDTAYIFSEDGVSFLFTMSGQRHIISDSLDQLENQLDPKMFFRANRQYIVSIQSIQKVHPHFNQKLQVILKPGNDVKVIVSKAKASFLKKWLGS